MRKVSSILILFLLFFVVCGKANFALAAPHFTLTPTSGSYGVGSNFSVILGVDSNTENMASADIVGTFDAARLEIVSIDKVTSPAFAFDYNSSTTPIIHNDTGKFEITLNPSSSSTFDYKPASGPLLTINFRAKAVGSANLGLTCQAGSVTDTNIINSLAVDVVDCPSNQSGSYTISPATGGESGVTTTITTTPKLTSTQLPKTGSVASTFGLIIFGAVSVVGALFLRLL